MSLKKPKTRDQPAGDGAVPVAPAARTVRFGGGCLLCRRGIALFRRPDRRGAIRFEDVSTQAVDCPNPWPTHQSSPACPVSTPGDISRPLQSCAGQRLWAG